MEKFTQEELDSIPGETLRVDNIEVQLINGKGTVSYPELNKDMLIFADNNFIGKSNYYVIANQIWGQSFELQSWVMDNLNPDIIKIDTNDNSLQFVSIIWPALKGDLK